MNKKTKFFLFVFVVSIAVTVLGNLKWFSTDVPDYMTVDEIFMSTIFDVISMVKYKSLVIGLKSIFIFMFFPVIVHAYISDYFEPEGVYLFVRVKNRKLWTLGKIKDVLILCAIYVGVYLVGTYGILVYTVGNENTVWNIGKIFNVFMAAYIYVLIISVFTILLNLRFGKIVSIVSGTILACILIWIQLATCPYIYDYFWIQALNPAFYMFILNSAPEKKYIVGMAIYFILEFAGMTAGIIYMVENVDLIKLSKKN